MSLMQKILLFPLTAWTTPSFLLTFSPSLWKGTIASPGSWVKSIPLLCKLRKCNLCCCCSDVCLACDIHMIQKVFTKDHRACWPGEQGTVKVVCMKMCQWDCCSCECRYRISREARMLQSKHLYYKKMGNHLLRYKLAPTRQIYCSMECFNEKRRFHNHRIHFASKCLTYK